VGLLLFVSLLIGMIRGEDAGKIALRHGNSPPRPFEKEANKKNSVRFDQTIKCKYLQKLPSSDAQQPHHTQHAVREYLGTYQYNKFVGAKSRKASALREKRDI